MHVFIGGAYNGKTAYVKQWIGNEGAFFCTMDTVHEAAQDKRRVISGLHEWVQQTELTEQQAAEAVSEWCLPDTVFILTEISRGVVPADASARGARDICGRLYQHLCREAESVTRIWYGIPKTIKGSGA